VTKHDTKLDSNSTNENSWATGLFHIRRITEFSHLFHLPTKTVHVVKLKGRPVIRIVGNHLVIWKNSEGTENIVGLVYPSHSSSGVRVRALSRWDTALDSKFDDYSCGKVASRSTSDVVISQRVWCSFFNSVGIPKHDSLTCRF